MKLRLPASWQAVLGHEVAKPYFRDLAGFLEEERANHLVFPPEAAVFHAFALTPFEEVAVLLLGQDPYHGPGQAHGLCFSVPAGIKPPPSLANIFKELRNDLGVPVPEHGSLVSWAKQGVLLLNTVLTVRAHQPNSHKGRGWETFTDAVVRALSDRTDPVVFVLWGAQARKKAKLIDTGRHRILTAAHPSPLSARKFLGSRPFTAISSVLKDLGKPAIEWELS